MKSERVLLPLQLALSFVHALLGRGVLDFALIFFFPLTSLLLSGRQGLRRVYRVQGRCRWLLAARALRAISRAHFVALAGLLGLQDF